MELYLHVPFCRQKCMYCDFASWAGRDEWMPAYVAAVLREAQAARRELGETEMETVFLGGGTPSMLPPTLLTQLLAGVCKLFPVKQGAEFTSECNPGTLTPAWLEAAMSAGVNRLSMGMQAAQPELLRRLGRIHDMAAVEDSVRMARAAGIQNLSLDLMFGLPGQRLTDWQDTVEAALALAPEHLSCYGLIPEEGTPLYDALTRGELTLPAEEEERAMYDWALTRLDRAGFQQYEISNFALPGRSCWHNLGYWRQVPYLGLGPSAASMLPGRTPDAFCLRRSNVRELSAYLRQGEQGVFTPAEEAVVTRTEARFETMMLGLRTTQGVSEADFRAMHGVSMAEIYGSRLETLAAQGLVQHTEGCWRLTRRGMDVQNAVLVALMD